MFTDNEKEELKRIISKYVEEGHCTRPIHPDEVMKEVSLFKQTEGSMEEEESTEMPSDAVARSGRDHNRSQPDLGLGRLRRCL